MVKYMTVSALDKARPIVRYTTVVRPLWLCRYLSSADSIRMAPYPWMVKLIVSFTLDIF